MSNTPGYENESEVDNENSHQSNGSNSEKMAALDLDLNQSDDFYQALTSREEADLEKLLDLEESENTIKNAEAFTEKLSKELSSMDSSNIHDIMASEAKVSSLMDNVQSSIDEITRIINKISNYESLLKNVKDIVQKVEKKEAIVQIFNDNNQRLLNELGQLFDRLYLTPEDERILQHFDLFSTRDVTQVCDAALKLQNALQFDVSPASNSIRGVNDQKASLKDIAYRFSVSLVDQLSKMITKMASEYRTRSITMQDAEWVIGEHTSLHNQLLKYAPLIKWLYSVNLNDYLLLVDRYVHEFGAIYEKEFASFFESVRHKTTLAKTGTLQSNSSSDSKRRTLNINDIKGGDMRRGSFTLSNTNTDTTDTTSTRSSEISVSDWENFDSYVEFLLKTINPICMAEQNFCIKFFDLDNQLDFLPATGTGKQVGELESNKSINLSENSNQVKKNDQIRSILSGLLGSLEEEFLNFVNYYDRTDGIYSVYFLVRLSNSVLSGKDAGSFLSKAYGNIVINVKRNFDRNLIDMQNKIEEAKDPKGTKIGVLSFIRRFETFARQTEYLMKFSSERRSDIDRWYVVLIEQIFASVERIATEHQKNYKTPSQIIELENFHYLQDVLSSLKISALDSYKKQAKTFYNRALEEYVKIYYNRPLEKLYNFAQTIEFKRKELGFKTELIAFQFQFHSQELRKLIKDSSLKDIRKGLEEMYKRVEKHVTDPKSALLEVSCILSPFLK